MDVCSKGGKGVQWGSGRNGTGNGNGNGNGIVRVQVCTGFSAGPMHPAHISRREGNGVPRNFEIKATAANGNSLSAN